ncbi:MAG TPA: LysR substrate-binding domain-containing protein [Chthoniobacterales bacterium]
MELRHLRYFVAVATEENVTRAAAKLHVSQPALSRQIHDLEDELGVLLLERTAKTVRLTDPGRIFLTEAQATLARADEAVRNVRAAAGGLQGEIRVGYAPTLAVRILPQALRSFQSEFPQVRVSLHDLTSDEMSDGLKNGTLDVAIMAHPDPEGIEGLQFMEIAHYPVAIAVAPSHPLAKRDSVSLKQLTSERFITYSRAGYPEYHENLEALFASINAKPRISEEHDGAASLVASVESSSGVALVSSAIACMTGQRLKLLTLDPPGAPIIVGLARRKGNLSRIVENFIAAAKAAEAT